MIGLWLDFLGSCEWSLLHKMNLQYVLYVLATF